MVASLAGGVLPGEGGLAAAVLLRRHFEQRRHIDFQCAGQSFQPVDRNVGDAALDLGNIGAVEIGELGKLFLAEVEVLAEAADVLGDALPGGGGGVGFLGHGPKNDYLPLLNPQTHKLLLIHLYIDKMGNDI